MEENHEIDQAQEKQADSGNVDAQQSAKTKNNRGRRVLAGIQVFLVLAAAAVHLAIWRFQPSYVAEAIVQVNSIRPRVLYKTEDSASGATFATFFNTQVATLTSNAVLSRCLNDASVSGSVVVEGSQDPLGALREAVDVSVVPGTQYLAVKVRGKKPQGLAAVANTIVRAYLSYLDEADSMSQNRKIQLLDAERKKLSLDVQTKTAALAQLRASMASDPDSSLGLPIRDPLSVTHEKLVDIRRYRASLKAKSDSLGAALKAQDIQVPSSIVEAALGREPEVELLAALLAQIRRELLTAEVEAVIPAPAAVRERVRLELQIRQSRKEEIPKGTGIQELESKAIDELKIEAQKRVEALRAHLKSVEKQVPQRREEGRAKVVARLKDEALANMARQLKDLESELVEWSSSETALKAMLGLQVKQRALAERRLAEIKSLEDDLGRARKSLIGVEQRLHELEVEAGAPGFVSIASMATDPEAPEPYLGDRVKFSILGGAVAAVLGILVTILLGLLGRRRRAANRP